MNVDCFTGNDGMHIGLEGLPLMARPKECSAVTGIHERSIRRMLNAGTIKGVRVGRIWYVNTADLAEYLKLA